MGTHSVGVTRQYSGVLGKQDNCQVAVSVTLACEEGSLPVARQLYLPHSWAEDKARWLKAGIPEEIAFATKPQMRCNRYGNCSRKRRPGTACWLMPVMDLTTHFVWA
jgi:SRSO17 transposase